MKVTETRMIAKMIGLEKEQLVTSSTEFDLLVTYNTQTQQPTGYILKANKPDPNRLETLTKTFDADQFEMAMKYLYKQF